MLSEEDNEILTRVGPGTLMGNLLRRYWMPALLSSELPAPDSPPIRVRILGEDLIAFRDTNGDVGLVANACPHRGASLFFGRNEEAGLRCVYHGWKFDTSGACVDMPSEPAESNFKTKVRVQAYPTHESGGVVWTYMGPAERMTGFRDFIGANLETGAVARQQDALGLQLGSGPRGQPRYGAHLVPAPRAWPTFELRARRDGPPGLPLRPHDVR